MKTKSIHISDIRPGDLFVGLIGPLWSNLEGTISFGSDELTYESNDIMLAVEWVKDSDGRALLKILYKDQVGYAYNHPEKRVKVVL